MDVARLRALTRPIFHIIILLIYVEMDVARLRALTHDDDIIEFVQSIR